MKANDPAPLKNNDPTQEKTKIMRTTSFLLPGHLPFDAGFTEQGYCAGKKPLTAPLRTEIEPEHRLYKLSREAASPKFGRLEMIAFLFFAILVRAATVYSGAELIQVVNDDAFEQTVRTLLSR